MAAEAEAIAAVVMEAAGAAIKGFASTPTPGLRFDRRHRRCLDSFQCRVRISLELLQNPAFPFASRRILQYVDAYRITDWACRFYDCLFLQRA